MADDGSTLDAEVIVESGDADLGAGTFAVTFLAWSGSGYARNTQYLPAQELVLRRLKAADARIETALLDSRGAQSLSLTERRVRLGAGFVYPVALGRVEDVPAFRRVLGAGLSKVARAADAKGSGNPSRRLRLVLRLPGRWTVEALFTHLTGIPAD